MGIARACVGVSVCSGVGVGVWAVVRVSTEASVQGTVELADGVGFLFSFPLLGGELVVLRGIRVPLCLSFRRSLGLVAFSFSCALCLVLLPARFLLFLLGFLCLELFFELFFGLCHFFSQNFKHFVAFVNLILKFHFLFLVVLFKILLRLFGLIKLLAKLLSLYLFLLCDLSLGLLKLVFELVDLLFQFLFA